MTFSDIIEYIPYLSIPLVSALVGWFTNVLALKMTFYPIKFVGVKPFGWQGIIPAKARKIAEKYVGALSIKTPLIAIRKKQG